MTILSDPGDEIVHITARDWREPYEKFMALPTEVHKAMEYAINNPRTAPKSMRLQVFFNSFRIDANRNIIHDSSEHIRSIKMHMIFGRESEYIMPQWPDKPMYSFAGFLESVGRMPEIGDEFIIFRGGKYLNQTTGHTVSLGLYSELKMIAMPK